MRGRWPRRVDSVRLRPVGRETRRDARSRSSWPHRGMAGEHRSARARADRESGAAPSEDSAGARSGGERSGGEKRSERADQGEGEKGDTISARRGLRRDAQSVACGRVRSEPPERAIASGRSCAHAVPARGSAGATRQQRLRGPVTCHSSAHALRSFRLRFTRFAALTLTTANRVSYHHRAPRREYRANIIHVFGAPSATPCSPCDAPSPLGMVAA